MINFKEWKYLKWFFSLRAWLQHLICGLVYGFIFTLISGRDDFVIISFLLIAFGRETKSRTFKAAVLDMFLNGVGVIFGAFFGSVLRRAVGVIF